MYWVDTFYLGDHIMREYKYCGTQGRKGEKRAPRNRRSSLATQRYNQKQRERKVQREIAANFNEGDLWITLKLPKGTVITPQELKEKFSKFAEKVRYQYQKRGQKFKWIRRMEIGEQGGAHIHMVVNRIEDSDKIMEEAWMKAANGHVNLQLMYESDGWAELARYICKMPTEEIQGQLSLFPEEDRKTFIDVYTSKNLIRPKPVRKKYNHWTMRKILEGDYKPEKGFMVIKDSVEIGENPWGYTTLTLMEKRIKPEPRSPVRKC